MSLYGALYTGVAGLAANSRAMANTSTNIANVNTVGYKSTRNEFATLLSTTAVGNYAGGVKNISMPEISSQGNILQTSSSTDLAISGQGFFVVTPTPVAHPGITEVNFTRAGAFQKDASGYLKNAAGYYLQGWALDANGNIPTNANDVSLINLGQVNGTALPTSTAILRANLKSTAASRPPTCQATWPRERWHPSTKPRLSSSTARDPRAHCVLLSSSRRPTRGNTKRSTTATQPTSAAQPTTRLPPER